MSKFSQMRALDMWYANPNAERSISELKNAQCFAERFEETRKRITKRLAKARARNVVEPDFPKLADAPTTQL
jgi:hypothetical protein